MLIMILVPKVHRDLVIRESKQLFAEPVALLVRPFVGQEGADGGGADEEGGAVAPARGWAVGGGDGVGVSGGGEVSEV